MLCDKLAESINDNKDCPQIRRGSRGSIVSGKANVETETSAPTISAHYLAKLSLSTGNVRYLFIFFSFLAIIFPLYFFSC